MTDDLQTIGDLQAHYHPDGAVAAANRFFSAVFEDLDFSAAWGRIDSNLRLVLAQAWTWANRDQAEIAELDRDELAAALAVEHPTHPLWPDFAMIQRAEIHEAWPTFNHHDWGAASRPRLVPPDCELVIFLETGGEATMIQRPTLVENAIRLLMRWTPDGWLVAGFEERKPVPGWPPMD